MAKKSGTYTNEDSQELARATNDALREYADRPVNVSSILQEFGGSKSALARELAGIGAGKLPAKGTPERTRYDTANRNIGRWLKTESGAPGQKRRPDKESKARLKSIQAKKRPISGMRATIKGTIIVSDDERNRTISMTLGPGATKKFLDNMQSGNTSEAYQDLFEAHKIGRNVAMVADNDPDISIEFDTDDSQDEEYEGEEED